MTKFVIEISDDLLKMLKDTHKHQLGLEKRYLDLAEKDVWREYTELFDALRKCIEFHAWLQIWHWVKSQNGGK